MIVTVEETSMTLGEGGGRRYISVTLSELAFDALVGSRDRSAGASRLASAVQCYLRDRGTDSPAWQFPGFLRGSEAPAEVSVELDIADELWLEFAELAAEQGVEVDQLAEHAAFYFAAEVDAGRITTRILEDLGAGEADTAGS